MKTAEEILNNKGSDIVSVSDDTKICDAISLMTDRGIGAVLVKRADSVVGIWTERDLLKNCLHTNFDARVNRVAEFMTTKLEYAKHNDQVHQLLDKFLGKRIRHLPVKKGGRVIGLLSIGDVVRASLSEKDRELKQLNEYVSWEFYENWRWDKAKAPVIHNEEGLRVDTSSR
jgi:CBS domain-containing protein